MRLHDRNEPILFDHCPKEKSSFTLGSHIYRDMYIYIFMYLDLVHICILYTHVKFLHIYTYIYMNMYNAHYIYKCMCIGYIWHWPSRDGVRSLHGCTSKDGEFYPATVKDDLGKGKYVIE